MKIYECPQCGALVADQGKHNQSHSVIVKGTVYKEITLDINCECLCSVVEEEVDLE